MQRPLEQDFRYLPACLIKRPLNQPQGSSAGYLFFDVLRQLVDTDTTAATINTENLIYNLTRHPNFGEECRSLGSGNVNSAYCGAFEAATAISASIEFNKASHIAAQDRTKAFLVLYLYDLSEFYCPGGKEQATPEETIAECGAYATSVYGALSSSGASTIEATWRPAIEQLIQSVSAIANATQALKTAGEKLKRAPSSTDYQSQSVEALVSLGDALGASFNAGLCLRSGSIGACKVSLPAPACDTACKAVKNDLDRLSILTTSAFKAYSLITAHRYAEAVSMVYKIVATQGNQLSANEVLLVAQIGQAKTSDDIQQVLQQIASPVGAWKLKRTSALLAVTSFAGVQAGLETLSSASTRSTSGAFYGAYVPVGIEYSWPYGNKKGYYGLYAQGIDLGILASDHANRSQTTGKSNSGIAQVLAPGIGIFSNPGWLGPVTFGLAYVFRTAVTRKSSRLLSVSFDGRSRGDFGGRAGGVCAGAVVTMQELRMEWTECRE